LRSAPNGLVLAKIFSRMGRALAETVKLVTVPLIEHCAVVPSSHVETGPVSRPAFDLSS
jgi:hypothetical protein